MRSLPLAMIPSAVLIATSWLTRLRGLPDRLTITPGALLVVAVWLTGVAWAIDWLARRRRAGRLRRLAAEWGMTYNPLDRLQLARRAGPHFPVLGAADLRVGDVIYGSDKGHYRYVFTAAYTLGTTGPKRRVVRAATFTEPKGRDAAGPTGPVVLAPGKGSLVDQYRQFAPAVGEIRNPKSEIRNKHE